jgi:cytochrome c
MRLPAIGTAALLLALAGTPLAHAGDTGAPGEKLFTNACSDCHSVEAGKNKRGPSLHGLVGRPAASVPNYSYSDAMKASRIVWTPDRLARYLAAPKTDVPGTKMRMLLHPSPAEINTLIAWLQQQK